MIGPLNPQPAELPPDLLAAVARGDDQIVIVTGAGCSVDAPTGLELAGDLSERIHRTLVDNRSLPEGAVANPRDLSALAQAVFDHTQSQRIVVDEFTPAAFRSAEPNDGHLILAALMREGAIGDVLSLNFDLSVSNAVAAMGAGQEVRLIRGPDEHDRIGGRNVIYLHRNVESDPDELILRPGQMTEEWKDQWEEVIACRVLSGPMTVFVGLGSPAAVLTATVRRIMNSLNAENVYVVGPDEPAASGFFAALEVPEDRYLRLGWAEFMFALGARVVAEHESRLLIACRALIRDDDARPDEDFGGVCQRLSGLGLLGLGRVRARWFLESGAYMPHPTDPRALDLLADLVIGVAMVERLIERTARLDEDGLLHFEGPEGPSTLLVASGKGVMGWERASAEIARRRRELMRRNRTVDGAVAAGIVGSRNEVAVPENIAGDVDDNSVAAGPHAEILSIEELRAQPGLAQKLVA